MADKRPHATIRYPEDGVLHEQLRLLAYKTRKSHNQILLEALAAYLKKEDK